MRGAIRAVVAGGVVSCPPANSPADYSYGRAAGSAFLSVVAEKRLQDAVGGWAHAQTSIPLARNSTAAWLRAELCRLLEISCEQSCGNSCDGFLWQFLRQLQRTAAPRVWSGFVRRAGAVLCDLRALWALLCRAEFFCVCLCIDVCGRTCWCCFLRLSGRV